MRNCTVSTNEPGGFVAGGDLRRRAAFSLIEVLVVIGILALLTAFLLPVFSKARRASQTAVCLNNLRQLAAGFHHFADDNGGFLPDPERTDTPWQTFLRRYISTEQTFVCPADTELRPLTGLSSYDWRDTGKTDTTLAGRTLVEVRQPTTVLVFDALPQWHARQSINVAFVDGTAMAVPQEECFQNLDQPISATTPATRPQ